MRTAIAAPSSHQARGRRQSAAIANSRPGLVIRTDSPRPSGRKYGKVGIDLRQVEQEVVDVHRRCGRARTGRARAAPRGTRAGSPARSPTPRATRSGPGCRRRTRRRGQDAEAEADPAAPVAPTGRPTRRTHRRRRSTGDAGRRDRASARRTGWRRRAAHGSGTPPRRAAPMSHGPLPAPQLDEADEGQDRRDELAGVPDAAAGRDPQDLRREAEQDRQGEPVDQPPDADPAEQHPAQPDTGRRQDGVDPRLDLVGADRARGRRRRGISATAGNGANGT